MCTLLDPDFEDDDIFLEDDFEFDDEDFDWQSDDWHLNLNIPTMNCGSYSETN